MNNRTSSQSRRGRQPPAGLKRGVGMKYHLDGQDIGMFDQRDMEALQQAFNTISVRRMLVEDDAEARKVARALIHLYRHGIRDPNQLISALEKQQSSDVA
jgi:hypothetical protein